MEGRLLLDVVVLESSTVLELLSSEDEALLVWGNSLLVLDLGLHVLNGVGLLHIESDGLSSQGLHEDLHATTEAEDKVKGGLFLDVVVLESSAILELLSSEDEALLVWGNSFLVLDLGLHVLNRVGLLNVKSDGLAGESLHEDLHATTEAEDQVKGGLLLDVVVLEGSSVLKLLASEDKALLIRRDSFLVLDLSLNVLDSVRLLDVESNSLSCEGLHEDLHVC